MNFETTFVLELVEVVSWTLNSARQSTSTGTCWMNFGWLWRI